MLGSLVGQYSTSHAMVRVISTALCCASGDSEMMRSNEVSSRSSKVLERCLVRSMPISSIAAMAKPSISLARTPTESTKIRAPWRYLSSASAMGERIEFCVQQNKTALGWLDIPPSRLHVQGADQREQPACRSEIHLHLARQAVAQDLGALVVEPTPAHVDGLDLREAGGLDGREIAFADVEILLDDAAERRQRQDELVDFLLAGVADIEHQLVVGHRQDQMIRPRMVDRGRELVLFDQVEDGDRPLLLRFRRLAQGGGVFQINADDALGGPGFRHALRSRRRRRATARSSRRSPPDRSSRPCG